VQTSHENESRCAAAAAAACVASYSFVRMQMIALALAPGPAPLEAKDPAADVPINIMNADEPPDGDVTGVTSSVAVAEASVLAPSVAARRKMTANSQMLSPPSWPRLSTRASRSVAVTC